MGEGRHADPERIELRLGQHLVVAGERARAGPRGSRLGALEILVRHRDHRDVLEGLEDTEVAMRDAAAADESDPDLLHG